MTISALNPKPLTLAHESPAATAEDFARSSWEELIATCDRVPLAPGLHQLLCPPAIDREIGARLARSEAPVHTPPLDRPTRRTKVSHTDVKETLARLRPDLPDAALRLLVAQASLETARFTHCYNFNLGNKKANETQPHTHLRNTWEMVSPAKARAYATSAQAHLCSFDRDVMSLDPRASVPKLRVTFQPPHPQTRFRAYESLEAGAKDWMAFLERLCVKNPELRGALESGDPEAYARELKRCGYYTASAGAYAQGLSAHMNQEVKKAARS